LLAVQKLSHATPISILAYSGGSFAGGVTAGSLATTDVFLQRNHKARPTTTANNTMPPTMPPTTAPTIDVFCTLANSGVAVVVAAKNDELNDNAAAAVVSVDDIELIIVAELVIVDVVVVIVGGASVGQSINCDEQLQASGQFDTFYDIS
jgi:hypothetical protein